MGRKTSKRQAPQKRKFTEAMDTEFMCPYCNHEKSCEVTMGRRTARISCRICSEAYQTTVHTLSQPIDVYNDWIDACEAVN